MLTATGASGTRSGGVEWGVRAAVGALLLIVATACSSGTTTSVGSTPSSSDASTAVNFHATDKDAITTAKALWRALLVQGVRTSITGYDAQGNFSLATAEPRSRVDATLDVVAKTPGPQVHAFVQDGPAGSCAAPAATGSSAPPGSVAPAGGARPGFGTDRCFEVGPALGPIAISFAAGPLRSSGSSSPSTSTPSGGAAAVRPTFSAAANATTAKLLEPCEERSASCSSGVVAVVDDGQVVGVLAYDPDARTWQADPDHVWLTVQTPGLDVLRQRIAAHTVPPFEVVTAPPAPQPPPVADGEVATGWENVKPIRAGDPGTEVAKDVRGVDRGNDRANNALLSTMQQGGYAIAAADFGPGLVLLVDMFAPGPEEAPQGLPTNPFAATDAKR